MQAASAGTDYVPPLFNSSWLLASPPRSDMSEMNPITYLSEPGIDTDRHAVPLTEECVLAAQSLLGEVNSVC